MRKEDAADAAASGAQNVQAPLNYGDGELMWACPLCSITKREALLMIKTGGEFYGNF